MLVLFETPAGYAIFKLLDERKLKKLDSLNRAFETPERAGSLIRLQHFEKYVDTSEALASTTANGEGKVSKKLKKVIKRYVAKDLNEKLLVGDARLGAAIKSKFSVQCLANNSVQELMRCIRFQLDSLLSELPKRDMTAMRLGLGHSLSRYKLKFSPDKIDTMIVQAVNLLGDLDKEINNYIMRLREWYGWHFPELGKIVTDHMTFAKVIKIIGTKEHTATADLSDILPTEIEVQVKQAAEISMGSEISDYDILVMQRLCEEIIENINYRASLFAYIQGRMMAIAPNVTVLVGELVGARLMAHAGSLTNLAKRAASTIQILGAEKALFRALKTKHNTPKYGLIYHAELVGQSHEKLRGKMSRMLAAKVALATRVDALGEDGTFTLGVDHRAKLEARLRVLEEGITGRISGTGKARAKFAKYHGKSEIMKYPVAADSTLPSTSGTRPSTSGSRPSTSGSRPSTSGTQPSSPQSKRKRSQSGKPKEEDDDKEMAETPKQKKKRIKRELREAEFSEAGPSGVTAGPSGVTAGPSGVTAGPSRIKIEDSERTPKQKKQKGKQKLDRLAEREVIEAEAQEPTSSKKKKKIKQELERSEVKIEEMEQPTSSKKKKKVKPELQMKVESTELVEPEPSTSSKKKKKKVRHELEMEEATEPEPSTSQQSAPTSPKKKKKKVRRELEMEEATEPEPSTSQQSAPSSLKKKKKKVRHELEGIEILEPEPSTSQQATPTSPKKKKKKVKHELDESEMAVSITEEAEDPTSSKKKKKKVRQEVGESSTIEESEQPDSEKKQKKKKKKKHDSDGE